MGRLIDLTGQRFGRLVVTGISHKKAISSGTVIYWTCLCDCGSATSVRSQLLREGETRSCGCLAKEVTRDRARVHGGTGSATYTSWRAMRERCNNKNNKRYANYGGRGIKVCQRWENFEAFLEDMGERPEDKTLERLDVNRDYEPGNCVWLDASKQAQNTTRSRRVSYQGRVWSLKELADQIGITPRAMAIRLSKYPVEYAMGMARYDKVSTVDLEVP